jgi:ABC-type sulfate/molybdate transport systems ATPase subunit
MLEIDVRKRLRQFDLEIKLCIAKGEILMLVGENGCGKTSLLDLIAGLQSPDDGEIVLGGRILFDSMSKINLRPEMRNTGYVFQNYAIFPHLSVYDNIAFGLKTRRISRHEIKERVNRQLEASGLWDLRKTKAVRISGGEKQRVALARALVTRPEVLLLDEPLSALDIRNREAMRSELRTIVCDSQVPSIIVTHDQRDIIYIGDRVCMLERGKIAMIDRTEAFFNKERPAAGPSMGFPESD